METPPPHEFLYRPNRVMAVLLASLAVVGFVLACVLATATRDPIFVALAAVSPIGAVFMSPFLVAAFARPRRVVITNEAIIVPKPHWSGLSPSEVQITFNDITSIRINSFGIGAYHSQGVFSLPRIMFASRRDFDCAAEMLVARVAKCRQNSC